MTGEHQCNRRAPAEAPVLPQGSLGALARHVAGDAPLFLVLRGRESQAWLRQLSYVAPVEHPLSHGSSFTLLLPSAGAVDLALDFHNSNCCKEQEGRQRRHQRRLSNLRKVQHSSTY